MASNGSNNEAPLAKVPNIDAAVSQLYTGLSVLQQQSQHIQKGDIEQLIRAALGVASSTQKQSPSSDTSSFLHSDDSNDSSRLRIQLESDHSDTQSNHSEQSESSGNTSISTASTQMIDSSTVMKKLHPSRPLGQWQSMVSAHHDEIPLVYHKSMARQFPHKDRTPEQLEMRRRNTEAARLSRAKSKMAEIMMEKEASELCTTNASIKQMIASQLTYANELCKLLDMPKVKLNSFKRVGENITK